MGHTEDQYIFIFDDRPQRDKQATATVLISAITMPVAKAISLLPPAGNNTSQNKKVSEAEITYSPQPYPTPEQKDSAIPPRLRIL